MNNKTIHIAFENLIKLYRRELSLKEVHRYKQHLHTCTDCSNMLKAIEAFHTIDLIQPKNNQKKWNNLFNKFSFGLKYVNAVAACFLLFFVLNVSKNEIGGIDKNLKLPRVVVEEGKFFVTDYILIDENTVIKEGLFKICSDAEYKRTDKPNKTSENLTIPTGIVNESLIVSCMISSKIGTSIQEGSFSICGESAKSEPTENGKDYNYKKVVKALYSEKVEPVEFDLNINSLANEVLSVETKVESRGIFSHCTSNNTLDVRVNGIQNTGTKTISGLDNKVRKVITAGVCREFRDSTSPSLIKFTVHGSNFKPYNTSVSSTDKAGFIGLPYTFENNDVAIADQPNSIHIDEFCYRHPANNFKISKMSTKPTRNFTIHIPVSDIQNHSIKYSHRSTYSQGHLNFAKNSSKDFSLKTFIEKGKGSTIPKVPKDFPESYLPKIYGVIPIHKKEKSTGLNQFNYKYHFIH